MRRKDKDIINNIVNDINDRIQFLVSREIELYSELVDLKTQLDLINRKIDTLEQDKRRKRK